MVLPQIVIETFAVVVLLLGMIFAYYDFKNRTISSRLFYIATFFAVLEFVLFSIFQFSIILIIPLVISVIATLVSYYTGNIGLGDLPLIASVLIFIFAVKNPFFNFMVFAIPFVLSFLALPFVLYHNVLSWRKKAIALGLLIITAIIIIEKIMFGLIILLMTVMVLAYMLLGERDKMYKSAVKYMPKDELVVGDLIENSLLDEETRKKLGINKTDGLTNVTKEILSKIDENTKLPIYSNSIPFTLPLLIGFIFVFISFMVIK